MGRALSAPKSLLKMHASDASGSGSHLDDFDEPEGPPGASGSNLSPSSPGVGFMRDEAFQRIGRCARKGSTLSPPGRFLGALGR